MYFLDTANAARNRAMLDAMLGFAAGVMLAASYWSLLAPAIEASEAAWGESLSFVPAAVGFGAGGAAMCGIDAVLPWLGLASAEDELLAAAAGGK